MKPSRNMWTGIALLAAVLTVAEGAAVATAARGAQRWWTGDQGYAVRRAGEIVGGMIANRFGQCDNCGAPTLGVGAAELRDALEPLAATGCTDGACSAMIVRRVEIDRRIRALTSRAIARAEARALRLRLEHRML